MPFVFRDLNESDKPLVKQWLQEEHVRRGWGDQDASEIFSPPKERLRTAVIEVNGGNIGLVLLSHPTRHELDEASLRDISTAAIDIDIMIGEKTETGMGYGSTAIALAAHDLLNNKNVPYLIAGMKADNHASRRAFEKAGFAIDRAFNDRQYGLCILMRKALTPDNPDHTKAKDG